MGVTRKRTTGRWLTQYVNGVIEIAGFYLSQIQVTGTLTLTSTLPPNIRGKMYFTSGCASPPGVEVHVTTRIPRPSPSRLFLSTQDLRILCPAALNLLPGLHETLSGSILLRADHTTCVIIFMPTRQSKIGCMQACGQM